MPTYSKVSSCLAISESNNKAYDRKKIMLHDNWYHMLIILLVFIEQKIIHKNNFFTVSDYGHFTLFLFCQFFQIFFD